MNESNRRNKDHDLVTFERRTNSIPDGEATAAVELTESEFHVE
jgi:hypothetical protein